MLLERELQIGPALYDMSSQAGFESNEPKLDSVRSALRLANRLLHGLRTRLGCCRLRGLPAAPDPLTHIPPSCSFLVSVATVRQPDIHCFTGKLTGHGIHSMASYLLV